MHTSSTSNAKACFVSSNVYRATGYGAQHPLGIPRIGPVVDICELMGWFGLGGTVDSPQASMEQLLKFHDADYIDALVNAEKSRIVSTEIRQQYHLGTMENPVFPGLFERASMSVGGSIHAAKLSLESLIAFHPAGGTHHGQANRASGFCYFNDPVFAILTYLEHEIDRVLYVDIDAHHGDGVQDAICDDPRVFTISIHEENRWPYTGKLDDRGSGNARNLPVPPGLNDSEFMFLMTDAVMPVAHRFGPQAIVVTCGADALHGDPLSKLELSNGALWNAVKLLLGKGVPTVVVGGGGYNPWTVVRCWAGLWAQITGQEIPEELPQPVCDILGSFDCDLVDEDEIDEAWLKTIADLPNEAPVRERIVDVARATIAET